jgi:hypothetical protein
VSSVAVKSVSICIKMIGCATTTIVSVTISIKTVSTTIPKKAFATGFCCDGNGVRFDYAEGP